MKITFYGHSCLGIQTQNTDILVDPFISANPKASHIDVDKVPANIILLTHAHEDHTLDTEQIALRTKAPIVSNFEIVSHYQKKGINGHPMNIGGKWTFDFGTLTFIKAEHSSSFSDESYGGVAGGFLLESEGKTIYISGDTALHLDMKLIPLKHKLDLAIFPVGDNFTMGYEDALTASDFVKCDTVLGVHYDTFGFIEIDKNKATEFFKSKGKELILLEIGNSIQL